MIRIFAEQKVVSICMFACLVLSIFLKIFLGMLYRHMIKETDNMAITNNKLLKQCKTKFSNCYELNNGIRNIPVFVDKFINRLSLGHLSFDLIYHLSGQLMLLSVVFAGAGICRSIMAGRTVGAILPFYIVSFLGLYLYFSVSTVADIKGKRRVLKINLVDYLENHLSARMSVTRRDMEMLYGDAAFQEKPGAVEGPGADRRSRSKTGKKTVELMPMGGRLAQGRESRAIGAAAETSPYAARETFPEAYRGGQGGMTAEASPEAHREGQGGMAAEASPEARHGEQEKAGREMARETSGISAEGSQRTAAGLSPDAAVTEEELEMLLKEFLTG
ncbi:MAG: hypothetical protein NC123_04300 [Butyrivibrio sp.]|nr:hypothetical protein [Acetatifactor muris]MCM1558749.1 hypothetical protein [Butyrivibrio sp.]